MTAAWRARVRAEILATWDKMVREARGALGTAGLPHGVGVGQAVEAVLAVAEAKGLLRVTRDGEAANVQVTPRGAGAANAIAALGTGQVTAWSSAVRAVNAIEADPDPEGTFRALDGGAKAAPQEGPQPIMGPAEASVLAQRVLALEIETRAGHHRRSLFQAKPGQLLGMAWVPANTTPPQGFDPNQLAEWATSAGRRGLYVPLRVMPDLLMALAVIQGAFFLADTNDGAAGPTALVMATPGNEAEYALLNTMRTGSSVEVGQLIGLLERWTTPKVQTVH